MSEDDLTSKEKTYSVNVTDSFDRSKKYYRVLRYNEKKYFSGRNHPSNFSEYDREHNLYWAIDADEDEGGFYFTSVEHIFNYMFHWGDRISEVTVPENATVYKEDPRHHFKDNVWRASEIILSEPIPITVDVMKRLIGEGGDLNNYNIDICISGITERVLKKILDSDKKYERNITEIEAEELLEFLKANQK